MADLPTPREPNASGLPPHRAAGKKALTADEISCIPLVPPGMRIGSFRVVRRYERRDLIRPSILLIHETILSFRESLRRLSSLRFSGFRVTAREKRTNLFIEALDSPEEKQQECCQSNINKKCKKDCHGHLRGMSFSSYFAAHCMPHNHGETKLLPEDLPGFSIGKSLGAWRILCNRLEVKEGDGIERGLS